MTELKPCPFCGSENVIAEGVARSFFMVRCKSCSCNGVVMGNMKSAIDFWNTRPIEDALRAELEQAMARITYLEKRVRKHEKGHA